MRNFINSNVNTKIYNLMSDEHQIITITDKEAIVENIGTIVSGDTNSCLLTFEINRFQDGIDLSDKKIRFNYRNSNGKFYDIAVNVKYNDELIRFSWLLPYSLTQPGGNVIASIEFYGFIEYDEEYSYKTKNFKLSVEKSLGVDDGSDESYNNWAIKIENDVVVIQKKISEIEKDIKAIYVPTKLSEMDDDAEHRTVSDSQIQSWDKAQKNVQSDWNEQDTNSDSYIKNKPSIPKVTNDLTDELKSNYDEAVTNSHVHNNKSVIDSITAEKVSNWDNKSEFDGQYSSLKGIPDDIATEKYVNEKLETKANENDLSTVAKTGSYNDLKDIPDSMPASDVYQWAKQKEKPDYTAEEVGALPAGTNIPSKTSDLENDSGFLTEHQDLSGYAKKGEIPKTASDVGADASGTAESKVSAHNVSDTAHNDIRLLVQGLTARLNALADSDDTTLDQMSEVVAYIKSNKSLIDAITTSKINVSDIIDNLTTNVSNKPLSAAQGVALKALIDAIAAVELDETLTDNTKAAPAGVVGELKEDLSQHESFDIELMTTGKSQLLNDKNILPDIKLENIDLWLAQNAIISISNLGKLSKGINFVRSESASSARLCTEIPYSKFVDGKTYRVGLDCGVRVGNLKIALRENKGVLGANRNVYQLLDTLMNASGTYRYIDFTFDATKHTDGYDYLELQIISQTDTQFVISDLFIGDADDNDYSKIYTLFEHQPSDSGNDSISIPINCNRKKNSVISNFNSLEEWKFVNLTYELNPDKKVTGQSTIFVTCEAGTNGVMQIVKDMDLRDKIISIYDYCEDVSNITACSLMMSIDDESFNKMAYFSITPTLNNAQSYTWNKHNITPLDWTFSGDANFEDLSNVKKIRLSIRTSENGSATIGFDNLAMFEKKLDSGAVSFLFDDGRKNIFLNAMPAFDKYGYTATVYVITEFVGTTQSGAEFMTLDELKILRDKGWTIGSHSTGHVHLSRLTGEELENALKDSHNWLVDNGFYAGSRHIAYPFGEYNKEVKEIARKYYDLAFTTKEHWFAEQSVDKMEIPRFSVTNTDYTLQEIQDMILTAKQNKQLLIIYLHNIGTEGIGSSTPDWSVSEFEQIIDYCNQIDIDVVNTADIKQMYKFDRDNY